MTPVELARHHLRNGNCWATALEVLRAHYPEPTAQRLWEELLREPGSPWRTRLPDGTVGVYCVPGYQALCGDWIAPGCPFPPPVRRAPAGDPTVLEAQRAALQRALWETPEIDVWAVTTDTTADGRGLTVLLRKDSHLARAILGILGQVFPIHRVLVTGEIVAAPAGAALEGDAGVTYIVRQGARWWYAGQQDNDPVVRFLHLAYAHGYLEIAHRLVGAQKASQLGGFDSAVLLEDTAAKLDAAQRLLISERGGLPPQLQPPKVP